MVIFELIILNKFILYNLILESSNNLLNISKVTPLANPSSNTNNPILQPNVQTCNNSVKIQMYEKQNEHRNLLR